MNPTLFAAQSLLHEGERALTTERLLNMFPESAPRGRQPVTLRGVPGLKNTTQLGSGRVRQMISTPDGIYAAVGGSFNLWNGATVSVLGSVTDGATTMAYNGSQVAVTAGNKYHIWDGSTFTEVAGTAFTDIGSVDLVDNFFTLSQSGGQKHAVSALNDGTSLDALDFASAEHRADNLQRVMVNGGLIWMFGEDTIEPWENIGATDFPFARLQSTILEKGLYRAESAARLDNTIFFHGSDHRIYRIEDFRPQKVSANAVDSSLEAHTDTCAFGYQHEGHDFLVVRFSDRPAWVYDPSTQSWHERRTGTAEGAWNATASVLHDNIWYAGTEDGYLCTFEGFQDQGSELRREAWSLNAESGGTRFRVKAVDLRCASEGGTVVGSFSRDAGRTWSAERTRELGQAGARDQRVQWRGLGQYREFAMRAWCADNVQFSIYGAGIDIAA